MSQISSELTGFFGIKKAEEETGKKIKADSERVYFICRKIHVKNN